MALYKFLMLWILLLASGSSVLALKYSFFLFLKCLLTSRLTLFKLSTLLWHGFCTHCIFARFVWSKKLKHSSSNQGLCCFHSCIPRPTLLSGIQLCALGIWLQSNDLRVNVAKLNTFEINLFKLFSVKPSAQCLPGKFSPLVKRLVCLAYHSIPSSDSVQNTLSHNSTPPYVLRACFFSGTVVLIPCSLYFVTPLIYMCRTVYHTSQSCFF